MLSIHLTEFRTKRSNFSTEKRSHVDARCHSQGIRESDPRDMILESIDNTLNMFVISIKQVERTSRALQVDI